MQNEGLGGARDTEKALRWYARAADEGHEKASEVVGSLLSDSVKTSSLGLKGFWQ
jgi:TPR repeat protein